MKKITAALTAAVLTMILTACSPGSPSECPALPRSSGTGRDLVLAVAAHANTAAPNLPAPVAAQVDNAILANKTIRIIRIDGNPELIPLSLPAIDLISCEAAQRTYLEATNAVYGTVQGLTPKTAGTDPWRAIALGASASRTLHDPKVIVVGSLLADRPPLDFTVIGMTVADPTQVASYLTAHNHVDLTNVEYELVGVGETAPPQPALSPTEVENTTKIWQTVLTAMGARVTITQTPRPQVGPDTTLPVGITPTATQQSFQPPAPGRPTTTTFTDTSPVRFDTNSDRLNNPAAAAQALMPIINWLAEDPARRAEIHGRTDSSGTPAHNIDLAGRRANTVKTLILNTNPKIRPEQLAMHADATQFDTYINDRNPDGTLNPTAAAQNRQVAIRTTS